MNNDLFSVTNNKRTLDSFYRISPIFLCVCVFFMGCKKERKKRAKD